MNYILFLGLLLLLGLLSSRLMKVIKLPNVTGYLIVGLIAAVLCIVIDNNTNIGLTSSLTKMNSLVSSIALGFIALSIGEEFKLSKIKAIGGKIVLITILQALAATLLVDVAIVIACKVMHLSTSIAIILGAIATATAPAATLMVIHQYNAKGPLVNILLPVVAFDDAIGLVVFSISTAISKIIISGATPSFISLGVVPLIDIIGSLLIGALLGFIMNLTFKFFKSRNNHMIIMITFTLIGVGACEALNTLSIAGEKLELSNLLLCMMIGAFYVNMVKEENKDIMERDIGLIDRWTAFLFMLFFVLSGCHLGISAKEILDSRTGSFTPIIIIFVIYIVMRSTGKYLGSYVGCKITKQEPNITNYLGITLLPQAGVAIGMANQIGNSAQYQVDNIGNIIVTVVLCATLLYEIVGPLLTKWCLTKTHEIDENKEGNL